MICLTPYPLKGGTERILLKKKESLSVGCTCARVRQIKQIMLYAADIVVVCNDR